MKILASLYLLLFLFNSDLTEIRKLYIHASDSEVLAKEFAERLKSVSDDSKTISAYKGASLTLASKFSGKLGEKISLMKEGAGLIDAAIASEPNNIELRLIRLSVQENVPKIVSYRKNKEEDKAFLITNFKQQKPELKEYVRNFILRSKSFTDTEKTAYK